LLSIGVCTLLLAGIAAIVKKQMIIANINLLLAMYYFCSGSLLYLCTLWETQDIFLQSLFDFNCVGIAIIRLRKSWYVPQMRTYLQKQQEQATNKNDL
jgi:Na+/alanine symporter